MWGIYPGDAYRTYHLKELNMMELKLEEINDAPGASKKEESWDSVVQRRRHERREADKCIAILAGKPVPVENWSVGGVLMDGDDRLFSIGQTVEVTLKFKMRNAILDITHTGRVVRKASQKIAVAFGPIGLNTRRAFQHVIDDAVAAAFADSQTQPI